MFAKRLLVVAVACVAATSVVSGGALRASDPLAVPDGSAAELLQFISRVKAIPPKGDSVGDLQANHARICEAIIAAAERVFVGKPTDAERLAAFRAKFGALLILEEIGVPSAAKRYHDYINSLKADRQPEIAGMAVLSLFMPILRSYPGNAAEASRVWEETKSVIAGTSDDQPPSKVFGMPIGTAILIANRMERKPQTLPVALQAYRDLIDLYGKSKNESVLRHVARCEGAIRRLESLGKPMELWGTLLDGRPFHPATLKGKVVLVEVVNLAIPPDPLLEAKRLHEQYRDNGFEVVAILMDDDSERNDFKRFMKEQQLAWPAIADPFKAATANQPASLRVFYGFNGEAQILLNRKGEVVSLQACGAELARKLDELLGTPAVPKNDSKPESRTQGVAEALGRVDTKIDPFQVPDGTSDELLRFIIDVQNAPRQASAGDEVSVERAKVERAVLAAADKILAAKPVGNTRTAAIEAKLDALHALSNTPKEIDETRDAAAALKDLEVFALSLKDDAEPGVARAARDALFRAHSEAPADPNVDLAAAAAVWQEMKAQLLANPDQSDFLAVRIARQLARNPRTAKLAVQAYRDLIEFQTRRVLAQEHPGWVNMQAASIAEYYGAIRWLLLTGNLFPIHGTLADGTSFDPSTVQGKAVLVELQCMNCGRSFVDVPNVKRNYDKYHARGFEVVEVVPEGSRAEVKRLREQEKIPWPILCEPVAREGDGSLRWRCGMFDSYTIGSPPAILIGRDGKVVSINAVGDELGRQLEALLK